jgi:hypothetical protein
VIIFFNRWDIYPDYERGIFSSRAVSFFKPISPVRPELRRYNHMQDPERIKMRRILQWLM